MVNLMRDENDKFHEQQTDKPHQIKFNVVMFEENFIRNDTPL